VTEQAREGRLGRTQGALRHDLIFGKGRYFTSNPDLPERFCHGLPLTPYVRGAFWGGDDRHYIGFPS
jgi:hypothetical protein